jgi:hypothetical protein
MAEGTKALHTPTGLRGFCSRRSLTSARPLLAVVASLLKVHRSVGRGGRCFMRNLRVAADACALAAEAGTMAGTEQFA